MKHYKHAIIGRMLKTKNLKLFGFFDLSYLPLVISAGLTLVVIRGIYIENQNILKDRLRERLVAIAGTAALQFNPADIESIRDEGDLTSKELRNVVNIMNKVRNVNKNLRYIYIWRKTDDPQNLEFVADAEMLEPIDVNGSGQIEEEEIPPMPGEKYATDQIPESAELFEYPLAQKDFIIDKWGTFLSGYAPIRDKNGKAIAVLGIDVEVGDFYQLIRATFIPFFILAILLLLLLSIQTVALIRIWRSRVNVIKELDHQKDAVLHMVAHQFKGPIATTNFITELLLDGTYGELTAEQKENVTSIRAAARSMGDQSEMVLAAAQITLGKKLPIEPAPLDLNVFFKDIMTGAMIQAKSRKVELKTSIPSKLPIVMLDRKFTQIAVDNLLSNALKYTALKSPEGGGTVDLTVSVEGNVLHCIVKDTGVGVPDKDKDKIFQELSRASNAGKEGTGLGLHVAKGAIESQGGKMWFTSTEGKGTTFYFDLPIKEAPKNGGK